VDERKKKQERPQAPTIVGQPAAMSPGDQVPPGTPGAGENVCPRCAGKGRIDGQRCITCNGTGFVMEAIGGA
jgi:DnaJ-class molecular chaperone